jgi:hypothetical protein
MIAERKETEGRLGRALVVFEGNSMIASVVRAVRTRL